MVVPWKGEWSLDLNYVGIKGTGSDSPENVVTNQDLTRLVDTNDEWIRTRTGIEKRHITINEPTSVLAYRAGMRALENAGADVADLDLIIVSTVTPDAFTPATACIVQSLLKAKRAAAMDVNAACTGLVYGMTIASQFIQTGMYRNALVIGAETLSKIVDWTDRNTCVLFGDGAGAVYLEHVKPENGHILQYTLAADGTRGDLLECQAVPLRETVNGTLIETQIHNSKTGTIVMQGGEVFKFAVKSIVSAITTVLKQEKLRMDDIAWIVPHQANLRIIDSAAKILKTPTSKFFVNLQEYGNTSSASIGIALDELNRSGRLQPGQKIILVGFGGGMTSGAILVEW